MFIKKINHILGSKFNSKFIFVCFVTFSSVLLETLGIASFLPVLSSLLDPNSLNRYNFFNLEHNNFIKYSLFILLIIFVLKNLILIFAKFIQLNFARQIQIHLSDKLVNFYLYRNYDQHVKHNASEMTRNIIFETTKFQSLINHFAECLTEILILIGIVLLALYFNTSYTIYIFLILFTLFLSIYYALKNKVKKLGQEDIIINEKKINTINQILSGIIELKVFNKERELSKIFKKYNVRLNSINLLINIFKIIPKYLIEIFLIFIIYLYFYVGIDKIQNLNQMVFDLSFYAIIIYRLLPCLNRILSTAQSIRSLSPSLNILEEEFNKIKHSNKASDISYLEDFNKAIELKNLCINYDQKIIFDKQNLIIKKNNLIVLTGKNGSGKTTIINILLGLIEPVNLDIYIDGNKENFHSFSTKKLKISYVPAKPFIINDTIKNNIIFFDEYKKDLFSEISNQSWFQEFISKFSKQLDEIIMENGKNISEGEKQKIALARALYNKPSILVLDEPTSNLDQKSKENFFEMVYEMKKKTTILLISHEDTNKIKFDYNLHLEVGKIFKK